MTPESGIRAQDGKAVAREATVAMEPTSCPCLACFPSSAPAGCYFEKTHHPPHPVGREDAQTDVGSLCHPGLTRATLTDGEDTGHTSPHWWHLGSVYTQPSCRRTAPLLAPCSTLEGQPVLASRAIGGFLGLLGGWLWPGLLKHRACCWAHQMEPSKA